MFIFSWYIYNLNVQISAINSWDIPFKTENRTNILQKYAYQHLSNDKTSGKHHEKTWKDVEAR